MFLRSGRQRHGILLSPRRLPGPGSGTVDGQLAACQRLSAIHANGLQADGIHADLAGVGGGSAGRWSHFDPNRNSCGTRSRSPRASRAKIRPPLEPSCDVWSNIASTPGHPAIEAYCSPCRVGSTPQLCWRAWAAAPHDRRSPVLPRTPRGPMGMSARSPGWPHLSRTVNWPSSLMKLRLTCRASFRTNNSHHRQWSRCGWPSMTSRRVSHRHTKPLQFSPARVAITCFSGGAIIPLRRNFSSDGVSQQDWAQCWRKVPGCFGNPRTVFCSMRPGSVCFQGRWIPTLRCRPRLFCALPTPMMSIVDTRGIRGSKAPHTSPARCSIEYSTLSIVSTFMRTAANMPIWFTR